MRKIAALAVSLFLIGTQTVKAEGLLGISKITTDGSLEVLGASANNESDFNGKVNDRRGDTITRVRVGMDADVADDVSARVEVVRNSKDNSTSAAPADMTTYGNANRPTSLQNELDLIRIQNAYVELKDFLYTDSVRLGRQYGGRKGDLLVYYGPNEDDAMSVNALDALQVQKQIGKVDALFVTGKAYSTRGVPGSGTDTAANDTAVGTNGDINVTYLTLSSAKMIQDIRLPLEIGIYQGRATGNGRYSGDERTLMIYDFRAGYGFLNDALNVGGEYAMNGGQDDDPSGTIPPPNPQTKGKYKGSAYVLKGDYAIAPQGLDFKAIYANSSGNNPSSSSPNDKAFHDGGDLFNAASNDFHYGEILSNDNTLAAAGYSFGHAGLGTGQYGPGLNIIGLGAKYTPANLLNGKTTYSLDYYTVKANKVAAGANKKIGNEIDLAVVYRHSRAITATAGYAMLSPGTGLASGFAPNPGSVQTDKVTKLYAKLSIKFGGEKKAEETPAPAVRKAPARRR
jgi:hypothetical protein